MTHGRRSTQLPLFRLDYKEEGSRGPIRSTCMWSNYLEVIILTCWPPKCHQNKQRIRDLAAQSPSGLPTGIHLCVGKAHGLSERVNARYSMVANFFFTIISLDASRRWCIDQWTNSSDMMLYLSSAHTKGVELRVEALI